MKTLVINLDYITKQQDWTVTDICRSIIAKKLDIDVVECHRNGKLAYTADVVKAARIVSEGTYFREYRPSKRIRSAL